MDQGFDNGCKLGIYSPKFNLSFITSILKGWYRSGLRKEVAVDWCLRIQSKRNAISLALLESIYPPLEDEARMVS